MTKGNAIVVEGLSKYYGKLKAVDSMSLEIKDGEIFGLLGPNGAGKTTLISMLVTMRKPSAGMASVNGFDIKKQSDLVRKSIGIVFQDPSLDDEMTAAENMEMHCAMFGVPKRDRKKRTEETLKLVGLEKSTHTLVKNFSGGMKRRLEIARGLTHKPKVLFLDEPTVGLDPQTRAGIWDYIKKLRGEGVTIILTTHYMDEADAVCDRVAIIDKGKIMALGQPSNLKNALGGDVISIKCSGSEKCKKKLSSAAWVKSVVKHNGFLDVRVERGEEKIPKVLRMAEDVGMKVESVSLRKPSLDDVFLHYTGRSIREQEADAKDAMRLRRKAWGRK